MKKDIFDNLVNGKDMKEDIITIIIQGSRNINMRAYDEVEYDSGKGLIVAKYKEVIEYWDVNSVSGIVMKEESNDSDNKLTIEKITEVTMEDMFTTKPNVVIDRDSLTLNFDIDESYTKEITSMSVELYNGKRLIGVERTVNKTEIPTSVTSIFEEGITWESDDTWFRYKPVINPAMTETILIRVVVNNHRNLYEFKVKDLL